MGKSNGFQICKRGEESIQEFCTADIFNISRNMWGNSISEIDAQYVLSSTFLRSATYSVTICVLGIANGIGVYVEEEEAALFLQSSGEKTFSEIVEALIKCKIWNEVFSTMSIWMCRATEGHVSSNTFQVICRTQRADRYVSSNMCRVKYVVQETSSKICQTHAHRQQHQNCFHD